MGKFQDISGRRFGRWTVLARCEPPVGCAHERRTFWRCLCDCGTTAVERRDSLIRGASQSCGCLNREAASARCSLRNTTHNGSLTPTYRIWHGMIRRCSDPSRVAFADYGGRGITVCDRWLSFENFLADMGERPEGMSIDRINNDGHYEPGNCRWATATEQARNTRRSKLTIDLVNEILGRLEHGESASSVRTRLHVSKYAIYDLRHGRCWADQRFERREPSPCMREGKSNG